MFSGSGAGGQIVPSDSTALSLWTGSYAELVHGAGRSVNDLDIHSVHSAYCYGLLMISIKRNSYNGGQLS